MDFNIFTEKECQLIKQMSNYWEEARKRPDADILLRCELSCLIKKIGILKILLACLKVASFNFNQ